MTGGRDLRACKKSPENGSVCVLSFCLLIDLMNVQWSTVHWCVSLAIFVNHLLLFFHSF